MNNATELTKYEEQLVSLLFSGMEPVSIAEHLGRSYAATKNRLSGIYWKLGVTTYHELISKAYRQGGFNLWADKPAAVVDPSLKTYREREFTGFHRQLRMGKVEYCGLSLTANEAYLCRLFYDQPTLSTQQYAAAMKLTKVALRAMMSRLYRKAGVCKRIKLWEFFYASHAKTARSR